jgi:hypothetical protein
LNLHRDIQRHPRAIRKNWEGYFVEVSRIAPLPSMVVSSRRTTCGPLFGTGRSAISEVCTKNLPLATPITGVTGDFLLHTFRYERPKPTDAKINPHWQKIIGEIG